MLKEELESQKTLNEDQKLTCKRQQEEIDELKTKVEDKEKEIGILYLRSIKVFFLRVSL